MITRLLSIPPPGLNESPGEYASRVVALGDGASQLVDWSSKYRRVAEVTEMPEPQFSANDFQKLLTIFVAATLEFDYYGRKQSPDAHPYLRNDVFEKHGVRKTLLTVIEQFDNISATILLVERGEDFSRIISGSELYSVYEQLNRKALSFIEVQYLQPGFFATFEMLATLGSLPPVPFVVTRAPKTELTLVVGGAMQNGSQETVTVGAFAARDGIGGFITVAHAFLPEPYIRTRTQVYRHTAELGLVDHNWDLAWMPLALNDTVEFPDHFPFAEVTCLVKGGLRFGEHGIFYGARTTFGSALVDAVDLGTGSLIPYRKSIYTKRCTAPGDSGAVLWGDQGNAFAMAFARTTDDDRDRVAYSEWLWLPAALHSLKLTMISPSDSQMVRRFNPPPLRENL